MCVIIVQPEGKQVPDYKETLKNACEMNRDGWGIAVIEKGEDGGRFVKLLRGMDGISGLLPIYEENKEKELAIHCRIGTSGTKTLVNTHPHFVVPDEKPIVLMHNGILSDWVVDSDKPGGDMCDTYHFARALGAVMTNDKVKKIRERNGDTIWTGDPHTVIGTDEFKTWLEKVIGKTNKVVLVDHNGVKIFNKDGGVMKEDIWFSNSGPFRATYHGCYYPNRDKYWYDNKWNDRPREYSWDEFYFPGLRKMPAENLHGMTELFGSRITYADRKDRFDKLTNEQKRKARRVVTLGLEYLIKTDDVDKIGYWLDRAPIGLKADVIFGLVEKFKNKNNPAAMGIGRKHARRILAETDGYWQLSREAKGFAMGCMMDKWAQGPMPPHEALAEAKDIIQDAWISFECDDDEETSLAMAAASIDAAIAEERKHAFGEGGQGELMTIPDNRTAKDGEEEGQWWEDDTGCAN